MHTLVKGNMNSHKYTYSYFFIVDTWCKIYLKPGFYKLPQKVVSPKVPHTAYKSYISAFKQTICILWLVSLMFKMKHVPRSHHNDQCHLLKKSLHSFSPSLFWLKGFFWNVPTLMQSRLFCPYVFQIYKLIEESLLSCQPTSLNLQSCSVLVYCYIFFQIWDYMGNSSCPL